MMLEKEEMMQERKWILSMLNDGNYKNEFNGFKMWKGCIGINFEIELSVNTELVFTRFIQRRLTCIVNPDMSEAEISQALVDPNTQIFQQALLSSTRSSQARSTLHRTIPNVYGIKCYDFITRRAN
jgi:hypothetical protein